MRKLSITHTYDSNACFPNHCISIINYYYRYYYSASYNVIILQEAQRESLPCGQKGGEGGTG